MVPMSLEVFYFEINFLNFYWYNFEFCCYLFKFSSRIDVKYIIYSIIIKGHIGLKK